MDQRNNIRRIETQAKFERYWLLDPWEFEPLRTVMGRERIRRTLQLITETGALEGKQVVDLGCGNGELADRLAQAGAHVDAVDIAGNALKLVQGRKQPRINTIQDFVPMTSLKDNAYQIVLSTDLIAYLPQDLFRLYFSEIARLVAPEGYVICSTPLDFYSDGPLERFISIAETELRIDKCILSYHVLHIKLRNLMQVPANYIRARSDSEYSKEALSKRRGLGKRWFLWNSSVPLAPFWIILERCLRPAIRFLDQSQSFLIFLERICRFLLSDRGVSHVLFVGVRRPLVEPLPVEEKPVTRKERRQVWE